MPSHQLDYEILGSSAQSVEIILDPGETVIAEAGAMNYMTDGVRFEIVQWAQTDHLQGLPPSAVYPLASPSKD